MSFEKGLEVFACVKENSVEYLPIIIQAITAGISEENCKLREQKSKVECGLVVLADKIKLSTLKTNMKDTLLDALKSCTFVKMDSFIEALLREEKE